MLVANSYQNNSINYKQIVQFINLPEINFISLLTKLYDLLLINLEEKEKETSMKQYYKHSDMK